jgi:integrase
VGESLPLRLVEDRRLKTFRDTLRARGVSAESVNTYLRHIRTFLNAAFAEGVLEKAVPVRMVPTGKRLPKILDGDERERVLAWALENDPDMGRVIQFVLWTGLRRSEVRGLRWENIRGGFARVVGKGNRERSVPLMPSALEAMGEPRDIGPVFPQWHPDTYSHRFKRAARAVGVRGRSFHGLRHSAATAMLESGLGLRTIQRILGHAAVTTTEIYADVRDQLLADEMSKLRY